MSGARASRQGPDRRGPLGELTVEEKRELLAQLLQRDSHPVNVSLDQQRLWFLRQIEPSTPTHVSAALALRRQLDPGRVQAALDRLVERHELLRSSFAEIEGRVLRIPAPARTVAAGAADLSALPPAERDAELARLAARDAREPFALDAGPLLRVTVVTTDPDEHVVLLTAHQLVADRAALRILGAELVALYDGAEPPPPAARFGDFVAAQRAWLATPAAAEQVEWWRQQLAEVPALQLPTDHPRPAVRAASLTGARAARTLPAGLATAAAGLAASAATRPEVVLLAAYQALLARYSGQAAFAVGIPLANRGPGAGGDWAGLVGPVEHPVAVPARLDGDPSFLELVERAARAMDAAIEHGRVPFERVVQALDLERDTGSSPVFQVRFDAGVAAGVQAAPAGSGAAWVEVDPGVSAFDLTLRVGAPDAGGSLPLSAEFSTDLFEAGTVERFLAQFETLLAAAVERPSTRLWSLPLLSEAERERIVVGHNRTERAHPLDRCLHELVEAQAALTPEAVAVVSGLVRLTYGELNRRANRLARYLRGLGVGPEVLVGVAAERSAEVVVGLLGVLKAGGAYVPLDPANPVERTRFLLDDAGVTVVLAGTDAAERLPLDGRTLVHLGDDAPWLGGAAAGNGAGGGAGVDANLGRIATPANAAYLMYTSGSTGTPKGVLVEHAQIVNSTCARTAVFPTPVDAYLMLAPLTFDASGAGLYWTLLNGGRLILPSEREAEDPRLLARLLTGEAVTHFDSVPSQYAVLLDTQPAALGGLRCCVLAGEALPPSVVAKHYSVAPETVLFNEYGPTETTVWCTVHRCPPDPDRRASSVPIGRPVDNTRVYVLDPAGQPAPPGVPGELHVAGANLARGYHRRPGLTAERFVPDPFAPVPGARMYATGDLARWLPDATLAFAGRVDAQVKVRGYRIEPGEVEACLAEHPGVAQAAVVARAELGGDVRLVAYVVARAGQPVPGARELGWFVAERLPDYMVPARFVLVEELPRLVTGKVDRAALPAPDRTQPASATPRTPLQQGVAQIFAEVLGVDAVGLHDDFFELGGNSLLVARVGSRLSSAFDIDLPVYQFFALPTVAGVSNMIDLYRREGHEGVLSTRNPADVAAEAVLDDDIRPDGLPSADYLDPKHVFLTGGTGYIGLFLLERLLAETDAEVHCLIRAGNQDQAMERLLGRARAFKLEFRPDDLRRVHPVVGDLAKPLLGLSEAAFDRLAGTVDAIYHCGALVNFTYPYSTLKPPNVGGTQEVLRLACTRRVKAVHYVSTIDVLIGSHVPRPFLELDLPSQPLRVPFSYSESKWVAERIVAIARDRGLPVAIYRPSITMGHSRTGACHETDYMLVALKGFLELGILPGDFDEILNSVTVDYAAKVLLELSRRPASLGQVFHIWNLNPVPTVKTYEWVRSYGYDFELVPYDEALDRAMAIEPTHPLYPMIPVLFLYRSGDAGTHMSWDIHQTIDLRMECANTLRALADGPPIECPQLDERLMHKILSFLIESGQFDPPRSPAVAAR